MAKPKFEELTVGDVVATRNIDLDRANLVRYAGASGDFNPIHWNDKFAHEVGLESVIAHGMLTMAMAVTVVEEWVGDQTAILDYQARFARQVPVPNPGFTTLELSATVGLLKEDDRQARIDLTVICDGAKVLAKSQVLVQL
ncbi:MaoC/PaaZ C-terminal domain-containing protein [Jonesiaceae bacterium BS-20]|uniref:MaoC/PaaZ C-terminal domain-containing protein n=1 Tax=Jonesiaceae bacterium BS-20 TaxID=3120821 RepID=A0AAU7DUD0_9MICO